MVLGHLDVIVTRALSGVTVNLALSDVTVNLVVTVKSVASPPVSLNRFSRFDQTSGTVFKSDDMCD